jgi:uncharacterized protein YsxB (DUF464 family)
MTRITLKEDGGRYSVVCEGHATGSREVCAAVSALAYSLLGWLKNAGDVAIDSEVVADGYFEVEFSGGERAGAVFELIGIGFLQLEASKGEYIAVF